MPEFLLLFVKFFAENHPFKKKIHNIIFFVIIVLTTAAYYLKGYKIFGVGLTWKIYFTLISVMVFLAIEVCFKSTNSGRKKGLNILKVLNFILFLIIVPLFLICSGILQVLHKQTSDEVTCNNNHKKIGIFIANFNDKEGNDDFSNTLFGRLNSDLQQTKKFNVVLSNINISESDPEYRQKIDSIFEKNCSDSSIMIFGNTRSEKSFNCRIYAHNYLNFRVGSITKTADTTIIYIQNPSYGEDGIKAPSQFNFPLEYEANTISHFTHGLIYNHEGKFDLSSKMINNALEDNHNPANNQFVSICHLFIGNNFYLAGKTAQAEQEFKFGISANPDNEYLHYNYGQILRKKNDNSTAYAEYEKAHKLNNAFENPLRLVSFLENKSLVKITLKSKSKPVRQIKLDTVKKDSMKKEVALADWDERCFTISTNKKYGVINNKNDTIISCKYDTIHSFRYKSADCFIVKLRNKYGGIIHNHTSFGYTLTQIKVEYPTLSKITDVITYCIDNH